MDEQRTESVEPTTETGTTLGKRLSRRQALKTGAVVALGIGGFGAAAAATTARRRRRDRDRDRDRDRGGDRDN